MMQDWASDSVCHNVANQSRRGAIAAIASSPRVFVETDTESSGSNDIWRVTSLCIITGVALLLSDQRSRNYVLTLASIAFFGIKGTEQERVEFGYTSKQ
jgi:hypothetical protein